MNNRTLMWVAAVLSVIGLAVNAGVDLDNMYDMTTTTLWLVTLIVVVAAAMVGRNSAPSQK